MKTSELFINNYKAKNIGINYKGKDSKNNQDQKTVTICSWRGCTDPEFRRGLCWDHYSYELYLSK